MECKCVEAANYEEALEKLKRGEFYNPEPKADYEIRIKGDSIEVKKKNGECIVMDYDGDVVASFEEALNDLEPRVFSEIMREMLELMSGMGYNKIQICDCGIVPEIEFYGDNKYASVNISNEDVPEWLAAHEDYDIKELLEKY